MSFTVSTCTYIPTYLCNARFVYVYMYQCMYGYGLSVRERTRHTTNAILLNVTKRCLCVTVCMSVCVYTDVYVIVIACSLIESGAASLDQLELIRQNSDEIASKVITLPPFWSCEDRSAALRLGLPS
jgi:hypothetical protein